MVWWILPCLLGCCQAMSQLLLNSLLVLLVLCWWGRTGVVVVVVGGMGMLGIHQGGRIQPPGWAGCRGFREMSIVLWTL